MWFKDLNLSYKVIPDQAIDLTCLSCAHFLSQLGPAVFGCWVPLCSLDELNSLCSCSYFWALICSSVFLECFLLLFIYLPLFILWIRRASSHLNLSVLCFLHTRPPYPSSSVCCDYDHYYHTLACRRSASHARYPPCCHCIPRT